MPVIKVWGLPKMEEKKLHELDQEIFAAVSNVEELDPRNKKNIMIFFPKDIAESYLGEEILIEVTGLLSDSIGRTQDIRPELCRNLVKIVKRNVPTAQGIQCFIEKYINPHDYGFFSMSR